MTDHGPLLEAASDEIPMEYRERFERLARRPARPPASLASDLDAYVTTVRQVSAFVTSLDPDLADAIAATCRALSQRFPDPPHAVLVTALVTYFVEEAEDDEITGVLGFDDDLHVVNAVCRVLGAPDLVVALRR